MKASALFEQAGQALYGSDWRGAMADDLRVRPDTVRHWANGRSRIPPGVWAAVSVSLAQRVEAASTAKARIVRTFGPFMDDQS